MSCGAQDLLEYSGGGKDSDLAEFYLWNFSVQLCQKEWTEWAKYVHSCTIWMVSSSLWIWICPPSPLCWLQHEPKMGYRVSPARPPQSFNLGWLSGPPSLLLIHVQAYCTTSYQLWKRAEVDPPQWILRRFTDLPSLSPSVRQSTFQNAERPVVDFPLVGCQSSELQDIGCS